MNSIDIDLKEFEEAMAKVREIAEKILSCVEEISGIKELIERIDEEIVYVYKETYTDYYIVKKSENCKTIAKLFKLYSRWTCY